MKYRMRDENKILVASFDQQVALYIFENSKGKWKDLVGGEQVYILGEDFKVLVSKGIEMYLWSGSKIYRN